MVSAHTSYVERKNLTSRQMNWLLTRKPLSFSQPTRFPVIGPPSHYHPAGPFAVRRQITLVTQGILGRG
jgi:hypothetical protein